MEETWQALIADIATVAFLVAVVVEGDAMSAVIERTRLLVWERDEGTCQLCGGPGQEIDRIVAKKMGGRHGQGKKNIQSLDNVRLLCRECHRRRHG